MSTGRLNSNPQMIPHVLEGRLWGDRDFFLVDVGASGGIEHHWRVFAPRLMAIGFDPLLAEVARLNEQEQDSKIRYEASFVTCRNFDQLFPPSLRTDRIASRNNDPFPRVSAVRAQELLRMNYAEQMFNAGAPTVYTDRRIVLDDFFPADQHGSVDFIKIDTDGHDIEVVLGADALTRNGGGLGFAIEAQFHGASGEHANTFANIDRFMRTHGFSLFDIDVYRYSRAALPATFVYDIPAQTLTGQVLWGEAIYFRDLGNPDYERMWPEYLITKERVIKLACLFELFGVPDCAAELLNQRRPLVGDRCDALLDRLAVPGADRSGAYAEYIRAFESDPTAWYPSRRDTSSSPAGPEHHDTQSEPVSTQSPSVASVVADSAIPEATAQRVEPLEEPVSSAASAPGEPIGATVSELEELRSRVASLKEKTRDLRHRLRKRDARIQRLKERIGPNVAGGDRT